MVQNDRQKAPDVNERSQEPGFDSKTPEPALSESALDLSGVAPAIAQRELTKARVRKQNEGGGTGKSKAKSQRSEPVVDEGAMKRQEVEGQ
jgi:hypothetical protein